MRTEILIEYNELLPGDILFVCDQMSGYFKHICVVATSQCDGIYNRIHTAGLGPVTGLIISAMFSSEQLEKVKSTVFVVRIPDEEIRKNFVTVLENWTTWAVSSDKKRIGMIKKLGEFYNTECNFETKTWPNMNQIPEEKINSAISECAKLFRIEDIIKYAQRREVSPVKPKENRQDEHGFTCSMSIITALQTAHVMGKVPSVINKWCSNKHAFFTKPLAEALKEQNFSSDEYKSMLINLIPEELRLPPKMTDCDLLARSIFKGDTFLKPGKLIAPTEHLLINKNEIERRARETMDAGQEKKDAFRMNVFGK